ncbi:MAG TPA: LysM peptidoglycan-binding domain-containing protein [Alphaproteobacteria bacterium]|nr:LysM peptidoglycan-binding domain-containing protein [Alphaproteobacteria bacterium]
MNRPFILAALGAIAILAAIGLSFYFDRDQNPAPQPAAPSAQPTPAPNTAAEPANPSFDIVRVNPKGDMVIAGRAKPGAEVEVRDGDKIIGKVVADSRGEWVLVPEKPLAPGAHSLNLIARLNGETATSESDVVMVVPEPGKDVAGREGGSDNGVLALGVPRQGNGATRLLQSPGSRLARGKLGVEILDFDQDGNTTASGGAPPGADVRVFIDGKPAGTARADSSGEWQLKLPHPLAPGDHRLKVEQIGPDKRATNSVEVAFARPASGPQASGSVIVVEPGNSLWRIARRTYGQGTRYTVIFEANRKQIENPDLIYPGQVFNLPNQD